MRNRFVFYAFMCWSVVPLYSGWCFGTVVRRLSQNPRCWPALQRVRLSPHFWSPSGRQSDSRKRTAAFGAAHSLPTPGTQRNFRRSVLSAAQSLCRSLESSLEICVHCRLPFGHQASSTRPPLQKWTVALLQLQRGERPWWSAIASEPHQACGCTL